MDEDNKIAIDKKRIKQHYSAENVLKRVVKKGPQRETFSVGEKVLFLGICCPIAEVYGDYIIIEHGNDRLKMPKIEAVRALGVNEKPPEKVRRDDDENY